MLRKIWIEVRSSLWFVPGLLVLAAVGLAVGLVELDVAFAETLQKQRWEPLLNAGAGGARGMLTAIASSMITVAGVAFSVTIVTLSLASTQYTPRILRNFMRDRANQFVLGVFVAIYTYCLVVLRTIRSGGDEDGSGFVPLLAVAVGMLLALLSIGCLIFFIHHVATSIQASTILKAITEETNDAIDALYPDEFDGAEEPEAAEPLLPPGECWPVPAHSSGYLQHVNSGGVLEFAKEHDTLLKLEGTPGDFVISGAPLAMASSELDEEARDELRSCFIIGDFRTVQQDPGFGIRQIVDIAVKALSPGINDTSTAVSCLDYLAALLWRLAQRRITSPFQQKEGEHRIFAPAPGFCEHLTKALDEIRHAAGGNVVILLQILCLIRRVALVARSPKRRDALVEQARLAAEQADHTLPAAYDRQRVNEAITHTRQVLGASSLELPLCAAESTNVNWS